jgi:uncharacterized protein YjiS (DUF1127 family)
MSGIVYPPLTNSQISARPAAGRHHPGPLTRLAAAVRRWRRLSAERQALAELSEYELHDIGASSADVYRELNTPIWRDFLRYPPI